MVTDRKIILEEQDIKDFEALVNSLPVFARNVSENKEVSNGIDALMSFMSSKIIKKEEPAPNP